MASAAELIYHIKNLRNGGKSSDDSSISNYQYLFLLDQYRATLIRQQLAKGQTIDGSLIQELDSSKIILTQSPIEKCELTTQELPKVIETQRNSLYVFIGTQGGKSYTRTTYNKAQWDNQSKYVGHLPKWYQIGSKLVIRHHNKNLKLNIKGVFESPMEVEEFNGTLDIMNPFEFEYPVSSTMIDTIIKMIADSEMKLLHLLPKDNLNDGRDGE